MLNKSLKAKQMEPKQKFHCDRPSELVSANLYISEATEKTFKLDCIIKPWSKPLLKPSRFRLVEIPVPGKRISNLIFIKYFILRVTGTASPAFLLPRPENPKDKYC